MTLRHATVLLEALNLEMDILSSIMLIKKSLQVLLWRCFLWCSCFGIFHVEKSPFTERGGVSAFVREAKKKSPANNGWRNSMEDWSKPRCKNARNCKCIHLESVRKNVCIHSCMFLLSHGGMVTGTEKDSFASIFWRRYALARLVSGVDQTWKKPKASWSVDRFAVRN